MSNRRNWVEVNKTDYAWEREALDFIKARFPAHSASRAWCLFDFLGDDGSLNEVDLLLVTTGGFFHIEIKSRPGVLSGDAYTWEWRREGKVHIEGSPLIVADRKTKKLVSLLKRQPAFRRGRPPFLKTLVFCSAPEMVIELGPYDAQGIYTRKNIIGAITGINEKHPIDDYQSRCIDRALRELGITRPRLTAGTPDLKKVGDLALKRLLGEADTWQDWLAEHPELKYKRRVRIYPVKAFRELPAADLRRAVQREFKLLRDLEGHPGILTPMGFEEQEQGPAVVYPHQSGEQRLDHFLKEKGDSLDIDTRLLIVRQLIETLRFAHERGLIHRALSPQCILVFEPGGNRPAVKLFNWHLGRRELETTEGLTVTGTQHAGQLLERDVLVYRAPEFGAHPDDPAVDFFSLGAVAYRVLTGRPPAANPDELGEKLRRDHYLMLSEQVDGIVPSLQNLVAETTQALAGNRLRSFEDLLFWLDQAEEELTAPTLNLVEPPTGAGYGDLIDGGFRVTKRLGRGATAVVFLAKRDDRDYVLKLAAEPRFNDRLRQEARALARLRHPNIVNMDAEPILISGHTALLLRHADQGTLHSYLRREGALQPELLHRFGSQLLSALDYLEQVGIAHRDIKPENIGLHKFGKNKEHRILLLDFSLADSDVDRIDLGTRAYLDPFLGEANRKHWDPHAERWSAAITLYEMAGGAHPKWGDGKSPADLLDCQATLEPELFDPHLRDRLTRFFAQSLRRDYRQRFDTAEAMHLAWGRIFEEAERDLQKTAVTGDRLEPCSAKIKPDTPVTQINFSPRARAALERRNLVTVADLLAVPVAELVHMSGIGRRTRRELTTSARILARLAATPQTTTHHSGPEPHFLGVDLIFARLLPEKPATPETDRVQRAFLDLLDPEDAGEDRPLARRWPSMLDLATQLGFDRTRIQQHLHKARQRWRRDPSLTHLRDEILAILEEHGGVMTADHLAGKVLLRRGSAREGLVRTRWGRAVTRAAVEVELAKKVRVALLEHRETERVLFALDKDERGLERVRYALDLSAQAGALAQLNPLATPAHVEQRIEAVSPPPGLVKLPTRQALELAVLASHYAALSGRGELYPRNMAAGRALKLARGALLGAEKISIDDLGRRVMGRYPMARHLPDRPELDELLRDNGFEPHWRADLFEGEGGFEFRRARFHTTFTPGRLSSGSSSGPPPSVEEEAAHEFDRRLVHELETGAFLVLTIGRGQQENALYALRTRFPLQCFDGDQLLFSHLRRITEQDQVPWNTLLAVDAVYHKPGNETHKRLLDDYLDRARAAVEAQLMETAGTWLLTNLGLWLRYRWIFWLESLSHRVGTSGGPHGLWLLVPTEGRGLPTLDGAAIPVLSRSQWTTIPSRWLETHWTREPTG